MTEHYDGKKKALKNVKIICKFVVFTCPKLLISLYKNKTLSKFKMHFFKQLLCTKAIIISIKHPI